MDEKIKITLIANTGVLVSYRGTRFLLDGIHHDKRHHFSPVPREALEDMLAAKGPCANVDYLLFSHTHPDHFTPRYTLAYLHSNVIRKIFMPEGDDGALRELRNYVLQHEIGSKLLTLPLGKCFVTVLDASMAITVFQCAHMGADFKEIENYCFVLTLGGRHLLFTADADFCLQDYKNALKDIKLDAIFINPLFYNNPNGRKILDHFLAVGGTCVIYHLPFATEDALRFHKMVKKDMHRFKNHRYSTLALSEPMQTITL